MRDKPGGGRVWGARNFPPFSHSPYLFPAYACCAGYVVYVILKSLILNHQLILVLKYLNLPVNECIREFLFSADGRPRHGLFSSHDALVTMLSSHNIPCSIVHPLKESNPGSLWGGKCTVMTT